MGVPAFYRWLSEKYPKVIQDVLEERVLLANSGSTVGEDGRALGSIRLPFDATKPNPSGLECDHLYIDMNGIIHPCSHPEHGPQPDTEEDMYQNVCQYVDRLFRAIRPRKLLYLAIDGVAPRAKMNQQRARRFRSAQEARELKELEEHIRTEMEQEDNTAVIQAKEPWDSNVITPGTPFMLRLAEFIRFYIRRRISTDKAWQSIRVIFSDASIPGEGEHKIMAHIRLQRAQPGYDPNTVHVLHGLDADLIMLALATHEAHFYISREEVLFGRKSAEQQEQRQMESGFQDQQRALDVLAGPEALALPENQHKPLQRISIPILREYLAAEFEPCLAPGRLPFAPSLERLIDDIVFLCFFVGNDFLPHLPSLDIRDGALDYLFNVYKRILPGLGDYMTKSGGNVNLSHVDVILAEVGSIEDYVFSMKHQNEAREEERRKDQRQHKKGGRPPEAPPAPAPKVMGRAAKILERQQKNQVALSRGHQAKEEARHTNKAKHMMKEDNDKVALELKRALGVVIKTELEQHNSKLKVDALGSAVVEDVSSVVKAEGVPSASSFENVAIKEQGSIEMVLNADELPEQPTSGAKRKADAPGVDEDDVAAEGVGEVGNIEDEFDDDANDEDEEEEEVDIDAPKVEDIIVETDPKVVEAFKRRVKAEQEKKLDDYAKSVQDNVRLHERGWKDRYYTDKCKADDVSKHGGREHLFRSYVMGLCWVMKYYYDGCPSWKWFYPFHYAPFASDLKNIERFQRDCRLFEIATPFNPVEQLMAVLPPDSAHAIPKESRWLMLDQESPIIDFYPSNVPVDPNGKAMPWLWVVLLPFIDEERLLAAMSPTMAQWTNEELLCNAQGLDDGYLFVHRKHPLSVKLEKVLEPGKTAKAPKIRLTDGASYGCASFAGLLRPPLSNELYTVTDDVRIDPPSTAGRITQPSDDGLFSENLDPNEAVCVAFTEPPRLSHKSILLPGAKLRAPVLSMDDKRIRRPKLNRGGGTIANLGMSNGQSHQSGYGSMNMGTYERELAQRQGRGDQMYQPGTRAWGAMEPVPKRPRPDFQQAPPPPQVPNPFMRQPHMQGPSHQPAQHQYTNAPPPYNRQFPPAQPSQGTRPQPNSGPHSVNQVYPRGQAPQQQQQYYHQQPQHHYQQQQYQQQQQGQYGYQGPGPQGPPGSSQRGPPSQPGPPRYPAAPASAPRGFDFRSYNNNQGPSPAMPLTHQQQPPPYNGDAERRSRASVDVMDRLRAQLTSTLNRRPGGADRR